MLAIRVEYMKLTLLENGDKLVINFPSVWAVCSIQAKGELFFQKIIRE